MLILQISWIRSRDLRILAIGKVRYTQDSRFTPMNEDGNDVWVLKINNARLSDSGSYECQVSYHDDMEKKLKMPVYLRVLGIYIFFHNLTIHTELITGLENITTNHEIF